MVYYFCSYKFVFSTITPSYSLIIHHTMDEATLNSYAAAVEGRCSLELLLMVVVQSFLREESAAEDDREQKMNEMMRDCSMAIKKRGDQLAISNEL